MMEILVAGGTDVTELASCLAISYRDNPLFRWMFADEMNHAVLCAIFVGLVRATHPQGGVYRTQTNAGAAIWNRPGSETSTEASQVDPPPDRGTSADRRAAALAVLGPHRPTPPHLYLAAVGVLPSERRRGFASALLAPVLAECDATGRDAYLENSDPRNTSFYVGLGFRTTMTLPMPKGCPTVVAMLRKAQVDWRELASRR
jgi:GNAT superfamily N-acetyltransferase